MVDRSALCVRPQLPPEGLESFLDRPWHPILNALAANPSAVEAGPFPLALAAQAPNSRGFLSTLGRPLAIAHDLESEPGVWWLSTPDSRYDFVVFSDCHRKNAWKGGQLCIARPRSSPMTPQHAGLLALCEGFHQLWGLPETQPEWFWDSEWFDRRLEKLGSRRWPAFPLPRPSHKAKP